MEKRYEKKVLEKGTTIYGDYTNPPIPEGYNYVLGSWNKGYTIANCLGDVFVWVPIGALKKNGVFKGKLEKFGRRPNLDKPFVESGYYEENSKELEEQFEMVKKYGGIYISKHLISKDGNGEAMSIQGKIPWTNINIDEAKKAVKVFGNEKEIYAGVVTASLYDSILEWLIESKAKTFDEIVKDSSSWGNFARPPYVKNQKPKLKNTGSNPEWEVNGICDLAGNVGELTLESNTFTKTQETVRGGCYCQHGSEATAAIRSKLESSKWPNCVGFRAVLIIK